MDNSNNPPSSNSIPTGTTPLNPTPPTDLNTPLSPNPLSSPSLPTWPSPSAPPTNPLNPASTSWNPPSVNPPIAEPSPPAPQTFGAPPQTPLPTDNPSTWPSLPTNPADLATPSTFTPPTQVLPASNGLPTSDSSPLNNPWGAPTQPPAIDGLQQPASQPTWAPNIPTADITSPSQTVPLASGLESAGGPSAPTVNQPEPAPTDLSHLLGNNHQPESDSTKAGSGPNLSSAPETLVIPPQTAGPASEVPTLPAQNHKGIPKWLIGVGAGLLIIVIGASAFFILGIGQQQTTTSIPAEVTKTTVKAPPPIKTPVPQPSAPAVASGSANFGELQDSQNQQATSAADLLRQGQQGR